MSQEQNNVPVGEISSNQQGVEQPQNEDNQALREYYLRQLKLMCPTIITNKADNARLVILKQRTARLIEMLALFDRLSIDEIPIIQKAVLQHIATENVPRKERQQIIESWGNWTTFLLEISRYRGLLSQFLQYHHRQRNDLEYLLNRESSKTPDLLTD